ncbi:hypothetical protein E2C01_071317 [Portunus trituberculatus]|uniref:Uncharacterized protein n=1 Tax=Portunus trituberculatus TaxID=210409 RepID=A0A5B7HZN5_PORTR|nr:hypothetical protein [Portunus trituberculatus]
MRCDSGQGRLSKIQDKVGVSDTNDAHRCLGNSSRTSNKSPPRWSLGNVFETEASFTLLKVVEERRSVSECVLRGDCDTYKYQAIFLQFVTMQNCYVACTVIYQLSVILDIKEHFPGNKHFRRATHEPRGGCVCCACYNA